MSLTGPAASLRALTILAYISGHGFGHWTRSEAVLSRLAAEGHAVHVRTSGRALPLARRADWAASVEEAEVGPGVIQRGPLDVDVAATRDALIEHLDLWHAALIAGAAEAATLGARLIYGDAPPIAFAIADAARLPSVALANFSWSWAYAHYADSDLFFQAVVDQLSDAEALATHTVPLPGGGGLSVFGPDTPQHALRRPPTCDRAEARRRLPRPDPGGARPCVLISFGGYGDGLDLSAAVASCPDLSFISFAPPGGAVPPTLAVLPHDHGLPHQDLVLGADALLAKPGYGTISECLEGPTPIVYVRPTGAFREHLELVKMIERWLPCSPIEADALHAGDWGSAIRQALAASPAEPPPENGLEAALEVVRGALRGGN